MKTSRLEHSRILIERAEGDSAYMASAIRAYARTERRDSTTVMAALGVAENEFANFLLCLKPVGDRFSAMVRTVCSRFAVDETQLLRVLRQVELLDAFAAETSAQQGLLLAARSRQSKRPAARTKSPNDRSQANRRGRARSGSDDADPEGNGGTG